MGASGALLGVTGAWFSFLACHWGQGSPADQQARRQMLIMTAVNIVVIMVMSAIPFIDWACHLFGLFSGLLLGLWYFGPALAGPAFAYNAPSLVKAQRAAIANARAIAAGGALPAIPGALTTDGGASVSGQPGTWSAAGQGRSLSPGAGKSVSATPIKERVMVVVDGASECLCQPMIAVNMACGHGAPPGLTKGALLSIFGLVIFFVLLAVPFGLIYGGFLGTPTAAAYQKIYAPCPYLRFAVGYRWLKCEYPYNQYPADFPAYLK